MNGYKRIMTAMHLKKPDHVPVSEFIIDKKIYQYFIPEAKSQTELEIAFDLDSVSCGVEFFPIETISENEFIDEWGVQYKKTRKRLHTHTKVAFITWRI